MSYWKDRVEHSRYYLPLSNRGIGDDSFYAYAGYRVITGEDPTKLVYDKPALGIVLLGTVESLYNPATSGLIFGLACLLLTFAIIYKLTKKAIVSIVTSFFLVADPLFFQNLSTSLLDLPQLFFLLVNIFCLQIVSDKRKLRLLTILLAGLALGIFAQIKIPVFYPFVFLLELWWLFRSYGKIFAALFLFGNVASLILGYIPYALHGYSFIEFIKIQKYIIAFYRDSKLPLHVGAIWQYLLFGNFPGIADGVLSRVVEWTIIYPLATIVGIFVAIRTLFLKKEAYITKIFAVTLLSSLLIFTFIPAYPRYVILILPFLYFFLVKGIMSFGKVRSIVAVVILLIYSLVNTFFYFHQSPSSFLSYFYSNLSHQYFQDIYQEELDAQTKKEFTISKFKQLGQDTLYDAKIKNIIIKEGNYPNATFSNRVLVPVTVTYQTEYLGNFTEKKNIEVVKENSQWKVKWHWDYFLNGFDINRHVVSKRIVGKRGGIVDNKRNIKIYDTNGYLVSFNPAMMDGKQEKNMLALLSNLSTLGPANLQNTYLENPPENSYIPLFTTTTQFSPKVKSQVLSYKGIKLDDYPTRVYINADPGNLVNTNFTECCTRIYSSYNYHGREDRKRELETMYEKHLAGYDGGTLQIVDTTGHVVRTIIQKDKKDGEDVTISKEYF